MTNILHIDSSPRGERSWSRRLTREYVDGLLASNPNARVTYRDIGHNPPPPIDEAWIAAAFTAPGQRTPAMQQALRLSDTLIDEVLAADTLVIGIPMYNFGPPANLKAWLDQIIRAGRTFVSPSMEGLAKGKRVILIIAAGQDYSAGSPNAHLDHLTPQLRSAFALIGITDIEVIYSATARKPQKAAA